MSGRPTKPNIFEPDWDEERDQSPFRWLRSRIGIQAATEKLGASLFELAPGAATFPLHAHFANEELLFVLSGMPTLTDLEGERVLEEGEAVGFAAGEAGAHRIDNHTEEPVRVLIVSTMLAPEINRMYESGTYWIRDYPPGGDADGAELDLHTRPT